MHMYRYLAWFEVLLNVFLRNKRVPIIYGLYHTISFISLLLYQKTTILILLFILPSVNIHTFTANSNVFNYGMLPQTSCVIYNTCTNYLYITLKIMNSKCIPHPEVLNKQLWTYTYINGILCSHLKEQESLYVLMWNNL